MKNKKGRGGDKNINSESHKIPLHDRPFQFHRRRTELTTTTTTTDPFLRKVSQGIEHADDPAQQPGRPIGTHGEKEVPDRVGRGGDGDGPVEGPRRRRRRQRRQSSDMVMPKCGSRVRSSPDAVVDPDRLKVPDPGPTKRRFGTRHDDRVVRTHRHRAVTGHVDGEAEDLAGEGAGLADEVEEVADRGGRVGHGGRALGVGPVAG